MHGFGCEGIVGPWSHNRYSNTATYSHAHLPRCNKKLIKSSLIKEGGGVDLLFHTNTESGKTDDLKSDPAINIAFLNSTGEWASVSGEASIVTDRETVRKYYSPALKAWLGDLEDGTHDGGPEDPRIGVIKVTAKTATYAIAATNVVGRGAEFVKGVVTGSAPKVNKLREISTEELDQCKCPYPLYLFLSESERSCIGAINFCLKLLVQKQCN